MSRLQNSVSFAAALEAIDIDTIINGAFHGGAN
jgi:hypothetical protein